MFVISLLSAFGLAVLLVEKGNDWPMSIFTSPLRSLLNRINPKLPELLDCTVCMSFWTALVVDFSLFVITGGLYFLWPLTGFAAAGIVWFVVQFLNAVDSVAEVGKEQEVRDNVENSKDVQEE